LSAAFHLLSAFSFTVRQRYVWFCFFESGLFPGFFYVIFVSFVALYLKFNVFLALRVFVKFRVLVDQCTYRFCCSLYSVYSFLKNYGFLFLVDVPSSTLSYLFILLSFLLVIFFTFGSHGPSAKVSLGTRFIILAVFG